MGPRTMSRNKEPFNLGIAGEYWVPEIPALAIPVKPIKEITGEHVIDELVHCYGHLIVIHIHNVGFRIYSELTEVLIKEQLMAAAYAQNFIDNYHGGNLEEETNTEA